VTAILAVPEIRLLLRPHPAEPEVLHTRLVKADRSGRTTLHRQEVIYDLVRASDVLVTQHSTVALEASLLGTVVVLATFDAPDAPVPYAQFGIGTIVRSPQELTAALLRLLSARPESMTGNHEPRVPALSELAGPLDGRAGERVVRIIADMLQGSGSGSARR
jgi:CDP-glycerol glycerophosphotransferase (TagB/SpsB family)